jgi:hypothetical protein
MSTPRKTRNWLGALPAPSQDGQDRTEGKAVEGKEVKLDTITAEFAYDKDTLNTKRFAEVVAPGKARKIGMIYIPKATLKDLGDPEELTVTVTVRTPR